MAKAIFVGLSTVDVVYGVDAFPQPNTKIVARSQEIFVGGPATNAAVTFAHLGGKASLVTAVGRNALASIFNEEFRRYSIQLSDLQPDFADAPSISSIAIDSKGERNVISANATRMSPATARADEAVLQGANALLVDGHYMEACKAWAAAAKEKGIPVVLDGGSWKDGTDQLLAHVHTAICSADFKPPPSSSEKDVFAYLKSKGVTNIAVTDGAEPVKFVTATTDGVVRVPQVEVADTLGAGDVLHGAFCFHIASGCGFLEALVEATALASESCRYRGTREWLKHAK